MSSHPVAPAFEPFYREHYRPLVGALSVAVGLGAAEEAVQEAFIQANLRWSSVSEMDHPAAWVRRVALNRLVDAQRRHGRRQRAAQASPRTEAVEPPMPDHELAAAVAALPRQQRLAISLYYLLDLPVAEVATLLKVSDGTVKSHLHDARAALRERLGVLDDGR